MALLEISDLSKSYKDKQILHNISAKVEQGDVITLVGASGAGKSTLLRTLNMLERPTSGSIIFENDRLETLNERNLDKMRQQIGMVFQNFNLFPNLTAIKNVMLGLTKLKKIPKKEAEQQALDQLKKVGLEDFADTYPSKLSGGQKQRVAIARSLAMEPKIMLFDEPTSALDPQMVGEVLKIMTKLANEGMTMVIVTHEMDFAKEVANQIWYMKDGQIEKFDEPKEFFNSAQAQAFLNHKISQGVTE